MTRNPVEKISGVAGFINVSRYAEPVLAEAGNEYLTGFLLPQE
ncbi:hypothetical protein [Candidatus Spongiihabitans sp.]